MKLDTKQKVLVAIYIEYQKDIPNMKSNVNAESIGISKEVFDIALQKLENEQLIRGLCKEVIGDNQQPVIWTDYMMITAQGIQYIEEIVGLSKILTGIEKVKAMGEYATEWGWEQLKDITAKTMAELISKQL